MVDIRKYNKIQIIGGAGSGKSWLAMRIAEITGYPRFHLDTEFHTSNWVMKTNEEQDARLSQIMSSENWVIEGNYKRTLERRAVAAGLIIFLDRNPLACMLSVMRRFKAKRPEIPEVYDETRIFSKDFIHICTSIWANRKALPKIVAEVRKKYPGVGILRVVSRREVNRLVGYWEGNAT